jgi:hypothetical protein
MLLDTAIYTASLFAESWYGMTLIHREFAEYTKTRAGIIKYRELFTEVEILRRDKYIRIFGKLNSIEDKPAIIRVYGNKLWFINGKRHRDNDKPAISCANGYKEWCINGNIHRENDQPAIIETNGEKHWYVNGKRHRNNDKPAIIFSNGDKHWYINSKRYYKEYQVRDF